MVEKEPIEAVNQEMMRRMIDLELENIDLKERLLAIRRAELHAERRRRFPPEVQEHG